eukprot:765770-Hanusia_phi.AAC.4
MEAPEVRGPETINENAPEKGAMEENNGSPVNTDSMQEHKKVSAKNYDATRACKDEKERREQMHLAAVQRKEEKEMKACTFKPEISRRSIEIVNNKPRQSVTSPVEKTRKSEEYRVFGGSPTINEVSRQIASQKPRTGNVYDRLIEIGEESRRKREKEAEEKAKAELESSTWIPELNKKSLAMLRDKELYQMDAVTRLTEHALKRQMFDTLNDRVGKLEEITRRKRESSALLNLESLFVITDYELDQNANASKQCKQ